MKSHVDSQSPANPNGVDAYVHCFYNQAWQELESRVSASENTQPETLQPHYQYVWSPRYIDAPVLRDKNTDADGLCDDARIYFLGDANFNVTTVVNTGGDALERYVYSPYGVLVIYDASWANLRSTSSYANAYAYTGRQLDAETGLYYYRARFYAAQLGRFVSRDPIGYGDGYNLFAYVTNRPVAATDPLGLAIALEEFEPVTLPTNDKGCSGWCFHLEGTKVAGATIDSMSFREVGGGCPRLIKWGVTKNRIIAMLKEQITPTSTFEIDTCSKGCTCGDKKKYDGKRITLSFTKQEIELDPDQFKAPLNNFNKKECFLVLTGKIDLEIGKGWVGKCCKNK